MAALDILINSLLFITPLLHLLVSPHTKVEESFNLQAAHDILVYGTPSSDIASRFAVTYDHFTFPGAVPRTFLGAVILAGTSQPIVSVVGFQHAQFIVRAVLGLFNAACLLCFRNAVASAFGKGAARWWVLFMMSQFHVAYYMTRTLPNMFAFAMTTLSLAFLIPQPGLSRAKSLARTKQSIGLLVFSGIIFRSEIAILLFTTSLHLLATRRITLRDLTIVGLSSSAIALLISVPIDSYFWQKPIWPELWGFYYNAVLGSSSNWGVSAWHYYFTSALPRVLLNPLVFPLIILAVAHPGMSRQATGFVVPSLGYVAIYSAQPHKEARFIFYVIPAFTAAAALGANFIFSRRSKSALYAVSSLLLTLSVLGSFAASTGMLLLSSLNYPGGDALTQLYALVEKDNVSSPVTVHADVLTCMTGLTLFGQNQGGLPLALSSPAEIVEAAGGSDSSVPRAYFFDKTEKSVELGWPSFWAKHDYLLVEDPVLALGDWQTLGVVHGYDGMEVLKPGVPEPKSGDNEVLGLGAHIAWLRQTVRRYTGGWWVGPRMSPRILLMKQAQSGN